MDDVDGCQTYDALAYHVSKVSVNRRFKAVSMYSLRRTANAIVSVLRTMVEPTAVRPWDYYVPYDTFVLGP